MFKLPLGRDPWQGRDLPSRPTLSRFENAVTADAPSALSAVPARCVVRRRHERRPETSIVEPDFDPACEPTHGGRQLALCNGFYDTHCYLSLAGAVRFDDERERHLAAALLRSGTAAEGLLPLLERLLPLLREFFPRTTLRLRLDAGLQGDELPAYGEREGLECVACLQKNAVPERRAAPLRAAVEARRAPGGTPGTDPGGAAGDLVLRLGAVVQPEPRGAADRADADPHSRRRQEQVGRRARQRSHARRNAQGPGYSTAYVGKWSLSARFDYRGAHPNDQGFDYFFGLVGSNDAPLREGFERTYENIRNSTSADFPITLYRQRAAIETPAHQPTLTKRYTEESVRWIREQGDSPFFLFPANSMPHVPLFRSPEFEDRSSAGMYGDVIEELDWSVGAITRALEDLGVAGDTVVWFSSDNGPISADRPATSGTARSRRGRAASASPRSSGGLAASARRSSTGSTSTSPCWPPSRRLRAHRCRRPPGLTRSTSRRRS